MFCRLAPFSGGVFYREGDVSANPVVEESMFIGFVLFKIFVVTHLAYCMYNLAGFTARVDADLMILEDAGWMDDVVLAFDLLTTKMGIQIQTSVLLLLKDLTNRKR